MEKVYICIPYTKVDKEYSFKMANKAAAHFIKKGYCVFSPITQGHAIIQENDLPYDFEFWEKFCIEHIKWCNKLIVVMIDGWTRSTGVVAEIGLAERLNKEVIYIYPEELKEV